MAERSPDHAISAEEEKSPAPETLVSPAPPRGLFRDMSFRTPGRPAPPPGPDLLVVTVLGAKGLVAKTRLNASDPYVKVGVDLARGGRSPLHTTRTIFDATECFWNETFYFPMDGQGPAVGDVLLTVKDRNRILRDLVLGEACFGFDAAWARRHADGQELWLDLNDPDEQGSMRAVGQIQVRVRASSFAAHPELPTDPKKLRQGVELELEGPVDETVLDAEGFSQEFEETHELPPSEDEDDKDAAKGREALSEEEESLRRRLAVRMEDGEWEVQVHIIEVRNLKAEDIDGTSDPLIRVTCFDDVRYSSTKEDCTDAVFDELFSFEKADTLRRDLEAGTVQIDVLSVNLWGKAHIGGFVANLKDIYVRDDHELYRAWVPLIDMTSHQGADSGVQGYLKVSVQVLGPRDAPKVHDRVREKLAAAAGAGPGESLAMAMPLLKQSLRFLVVSIYEAEWVPTADRTVVTRREGGGDYRVGVKFGVHPQVLTKTHSKTGSGRKHFGIKERLWVPYLDPCFDTKIHMSLLDQDLGGREIVANARVMDILDLKARPEAFDNLWLNLYGPPVPTPQVLGDNYKKMLRDPDVGSAYRGRIRVSLREVGPGDTADGRSRPRQRPKQQRSFRFRLPKPPPRLPEVTYNVKFDVYMATELHGFKIRGDFAVELHWGPLGADRDPLTTQFRSDDRGTCSWSQDLAAEGIPFLPAPEPEAPAARRAAMPDLFVYLLRKDPMAMQRSTKISFARIPFADCALDLENPTQLEPRWIALERCAVEGALGPSNAAGNVLLRVALGPPEAFAAIPTDHHSLNISRERSHYKLLVHVFQARDLPPSDLNGSLDPYIVVRFNGEKRELPYVTRCCDPVFNETVVFDGLLYQRPSLRPRVSFLVYDHDWGVDDYIGQATTEIQAEVEAAEDWNDANKPWPPARPEPVEVPLMRHGLPLQARILVGFHLVAAGDAEVAAIAANAKAKEKGLSTRMRGAGKDAEIRGFPLARALPPHFCKPVERTAFVEVLGLGLRDLKAAGLRPASNPSLHLRIGQQVLVLRAQSGGRGTRSTDPNFLQRVVFETLLPRDVTFLPNISLAVHEGILTRLGLSGSILGSGSVALSARTPLTIHTAADGTTEETYNPAFEPNGARPRMGNPFRPRLAAEPSARQLMRSPAPSATESKSDGETEAEALRRQVAEALVPDFLKGREMLDYELELDLGPGPWQEYPIYRGTYSSGVLGLSEARSLEDCVRQVGSFKAIVRVLGEDPRSTPPEDVLYPPLPPVVDHLFSGATLDDRLVHVHLYVLRAQRLKPTDQSGRADPFLRVRWGSQTLSLRDRAHRDTLDPEFFERVDLQLSIPGMSKVWIDVVDRVGLGGGFRDKVIGTTCLDLEDRWFSPAWHGLHADHRPVETRKLYVPEEAHSQGLLTLWVDLVARSQARLYRPLAIAPPPTEAWEVRVVVYKAQLDMRRISTDLVTGMVDAYFRGWLAHQEKQDTDTHLRIQNGRGSWNWRYKYPVTLPSAATDEGGGYFHLHAWDVDMIHNEALGGYFTDLSVDFQKAYLRKEVYNVFKERRPKKRHVLQNLKDLRGDVEQALHSTEETPLMSGSKAPKRKKSRKQQPSTVWSRLKHGVGVGELPDGAEWIDLKTTPPGDKRPVVVGKALVSIELVPEAVTKLRPAGYGRAEPNSNPFLPPPEGRPDLTRMWNPLYLLSVCIGEGLLMKFGCLLFCVGFLALLFFVGPVFLDVLQLMVALPAAGMPLALGITACSVATCMYGYFRCRTVCCTVDDDDHEYEEVASSAEYYDEENTASFETDTH